MPARVFRSLSLTSLAVAFAMSLLVAVAQRAAPSDTFERPQPSSFQTPAPVTESIGEATASAPAVGAIDEAATTVPASASPETAPVRSDAGQRLEASPVGVLAAAPGGAALAGAAPDSGVSGLVLLGPVCPRPSQVLACTAPVGATLSVFRSGTSAPVASVPIGPLGRFQIALQPGSYMLRVIVPQAQTGPREATRAVTVKPHEFALEVIRFSSTQIR